VVCVGGRGGLPEGPGSVPTYNEERLIFYAYFSDSFTIFALIQSTNLATLV